MWILTPIGFFSAVQKPGDAGLTIRVRVAGDLDALRTRYLPHLSPTESHGGTDYPFRARCTHEEWAVALTRMTLDIDYANFKSEVAKRQGSARAHVYSDVWSVLHKLESSAPAAKPIATAAHTTAAKAALPAKHAVAEPPHAPVTKQPMGRHPSGKWFSYGGIVMRPDGQVLMRKVKGGYDGEGWTWTKGKAETGESPEQTAMREVGEETGVLAEIVCALPGEHHGTSSVTRYWLMRPLEESGNFDPVETEAIAWVTPAEARHRIQTTTRVKVKVDRDLAVLDAALSAFSVQK